MQPSLILLPLLIVGFARSRDNLTISGVVMAAIALALQPDRAMAGALLAGLASIAAFTRDRFTVLPLVSAAFAFMITIAKPELVPATPFVDGVLRTAFSTGAAPGLAVWLGAAILVSPAVLGVIYDRANRPVHAAFGATWSTIVLAAVVADFPTPVVAYGGSAIVGYILVSLALPRRWGVAPEAVETVAIHRDKSDAKFPADRLRLADHQDHDGSLQPHPWGSSAMMESSRRSLSP